MFGFIATCLANEIYGRADLTDPGTLFADFNELTGLEKLNSDFIFYCKHCFMGTGFVLTDAASRFDCCGVVSAWEFQSDFADTIDFQVWENVDVGNKQATMKAFNQLTGEQGA